MRIRNPNLAHTQLQLRNGSVVTGDAEGIFDVPEDVALVLLKSPGWTGIRHARPIGAVSDKPSVTAPLLPPPPPPVLVPEVVEPEPIVAPEPPPVAPPAEDEEDGPELEGMNRDQLLAVAKQYGVEVNPRWGTEKLRTLLDKTIYGEE